MFKNSLLGFIVNPDYTFFSHAGLSINALNFGCGNRKSEGEIGVDVSPNTDADYVVSPGDSLPFADNYFDLIVSRYVLEHVEDLDQLLGEFCRVLKSGGCLRFCVPHALSIDMYDDPTHRRFFTLRTMNYYTGISNVHYASSGFCRVTPYLRLTLAWPRWRVIRYPINLVLGAVGLLAPNFAENLLKLPFITGTLFFELEKNKCQ